jgi:hypothetical protein
VVAVSVLAMATDHRHADCAVLRGSRSLQVTRHQGSVLLSVLHQQTLAASDLSAHHHHQRSQMTVSVTCHQQASVLMYQEERMDLSVLLVDHQHQPDH